MNLLIDIMIKKMKKLDIMIHSGKWIFIRFNPDDTKTIKVDIEDKLICLIETIQKHIDRIENDENKKPLEIFPLYFDL